MSRKQARFGQPAVYNASGPNLSDNDDSALNVDSSGILKAALAYTGSSSSTVQGAGADNAAVVGNPQLAAGKYNLSTQTYDDGDTATLQSDINGALIVNNKPLDEDIDSATAYIKGATQTKLSASGVISAVPCVLVGYYVEASSTGVISLYDNASAASGNTMLANSKTVAANDVVSLGHPVVMANGVYFSLASGTATVYVFTRKVTLS